VTPSEEVITLEVDVVCDTAANIPNDSDHSMPTHALLAAELRIVQVSPSGEVITLVPEPLLEVAANNPNDGDQATDRQLLEGVGLSVQFTPSGEVIT